MKASIYIKIAAFCIAIVSLIQLKGFASIGSSSFQGDEASFGIPCSTHEQKTTRSTQEQKMTQASFNALNARLLGLDVTDCGVPGMRKDCERACAFLDVRTSALVEDVKLNSASLNSLEDRKREAHVRQR